MSNEEFAGAASQVLDEAVEWAARVHCDTIEKLNDAIDKGYATGIILISEALQERKIAAIADRVMNNPGIKVILIAGPSSSGKTSFTQRLRVQLGVDAIRTVSLSMDNYFVERINSPRKPDGSYDYERPEALDIELFNSQIKRLAAGETVEIPYYDFKTGMKQYRGEKITLEGHTVLLVEGIHGLNEQMTASLGADQKLKIYITPLNPLILPDGSSISLSDVRLIRRIVRDSQYRSLNAASTIEMWGTVREGEQKYVYPNAVHADVIVNTSLIYELSVLKPFVVPLLEELTVLENGTGRKAMQLLKSLRHIRTISIHDIPLTSIMREFVGGSTFSKVL